MIAIGQTEAPYLNRYMATSSEPGRTSAYSNDLRWKMVYQREALSLTFSVIASNLCVDVSTVKRVLKLFRETGSVTKKPYPKERSSRKLTPVLQFFLLDLILSNPGIYLHEIQLRIQEEFYLTIDCSTICRFLHKSGFSHQRLRIVASQQNEYLRASYAIDVSLYHKDMLVFVDETGCDRRNLLRKKGYSIRGKPAVTHKLLVRGEHVSVIAAISTKGLLDVKICRGGVDSDTFYDFINDNLLPFLYPFEDNNPQSVVILDNCKIHHAYETVHTIQECGALVHFLPPYSPDLNPIENIFSKVKTTLKEQETFYPELDIDTLILSALSTVTSNDCIHSIENCILYK